VPHCQLHTSERRLSYYLDMDDGPLVAVTCPYCGEEVEIYVEEDVHGTFVQDCEVCCNPWLVRVSRGVDGRSVSVSRGDGSE
jgi:hypothetical protein